MVLAKDIGLKIGTKEILKAVSLQLLNGEIVAVCGPNGAGKSTFLRVLSGEYEATKGSVSFLGKKLREWRISDLALHRAVLNQESMLTFPFRVSEVVAFGRYPYPKSTQNNEIIEFCMKEVEISHLRNRLYTTLSGGEKQRVHLARILAQLEGPESDKLLLLDEPTSALDLKHQERVLQMAQRIAKKKRYSVLVVLHDLNLAAAYADRILFMKKGMGVYEGVPDEVLTSKNVKEIFDIDAHILHHPDTNRPFLVLDRKLQQEYIWR